MDAATEAVRRSGLIGPLTRTTRSGFPPGKELEGMN
jgi:hypothetical protein